LAGYFALIRLVGQISPADERTLSIPPYRLARWEFVASFTMRARSGPACSTDGACMAVMQRCTSFCHLTPMNPIEPFHLPLVPKLTAVTLRVGLVPTRATRIADTGRIPAVRTERQGSPGWTGSRPPARTCLRICLWRPSCDVEKNHGNNENDRLRHASLRREILRR